ncbi:MAG: thiopurine S-methyltransferase [Gammaproteobacteria bacterium]
MEAAFWHERWQSNNIAFHQPQIHSSLRQFWPSLGIAPGATVFVPLCGKSLDLGWLADQGHPVLGVELSTLAVEAFFREHKRVPEVRSEGGFQVWHSAGITLLCGDFFALQAEHLRAVAGVYDRAALVALPPALRADYIRHLRAILPVPLPTLLVTLEYDQREMNGPPFAVLEQEVRDRYGADYAVRLLHDHDILPESPHFRAKGVTAMREKSYVLQPLAAPA